MNSEKKSILVVDDEEDLTWSISRNLKKVDNLLDVHCVNTGDAALVFAESHPVDLLITDVRMPGTDGLQLARLVRGMQPDVKVIVMTAYGSDVLEEAVNELGSPYYIEKPFELRYLRKLVFEALEPSAEEMNDCFAGERIKEVIATNCLSNATSLLTLQSGPSRGAIYFQEGEIVHAECDDLEGERALYNILDWKKANFHVRSNLIASKRTIRRNWQVLLNATMID